jgi:hypothetical protein
VIRTRALAVLRGVDVWAEARRWEELRGGPYDAVLCVGNALTHAEDRRMALRGMRRVASDGALLAITSRNWERPQAGGEEVVERGGRRATVRRAWVPGALEIEMTLHGEVYAERLAYWPFSHEELREDLRATGFEVARSTWDPGVDRYLVTARAQPST